MEGWEVFAGAGVRRDYTVSELGAEVDAFLGEAFRDVWVVGSVARLRPHSNGHLYFELIEKGRGDQLVGRLDAVVWARDRRRVEATLRRSHIELADGIEARCRIQLGFWGPGGRLQASVREIDPVFSLGMLERRRRQVREQLAAMGVLEANRTREMPLLPLKVGLVASRDSAAYHDVMASLRASGRPFRVVHVDARVQGAAAEHELVRALRQLDRLESIDVIAIVRGGGARGDLAAFDSLAVARAVAQARVPVLTGLGHETDSTICDEVAWRACHTPTRVAEVLVAAVEEADRAVDQAARRIGSLGERSVLLARHRLGRARLALAPAARRIERAEVRLVLQRERLGALGERRVARAAEVLELRLEKLRSGAFGELARRREALAGRTQRLPEQAHRFLEQQDRKLVGLTRLTRELGPRRWLERGFAVMRTREGTVVRSSAQVGVGDSVITELAAGSVVSRIEEVVG